MYKLIRNIVVNLNGFSVNDVLATDYDTLIEILCTENKPNKKVHSLHDVVRGMG